MANPSSIGKQPAVLEATTAAAFVAIDTLSRYSVIHDGVEDDGATASTAIIYLAYGNVDPDATGDEGANRFRLKNGRGITIGPGISGFSFKAASGVTTISVLPDGELLANS